MAPVAFTWTNRARPVVEIGVGDARIGGVGAQWDVHRWDQAGAIWSGVEPTWLDVTCDVRTWRCEYGRRRSVERFVPGVATVVVDNGSGWADPNAVEVPGVLTMRPGRAIRMGITHAVYGTRWLFRGFLDAMNPTYDPVERDTVEFQCIDALGEVNRAKTVPLTVPTGAGETATARIVRLLDIAKWPATKRRLDAVVDTLIASDMGGQTADLLGQAADSNGGSIYGDTEANVVFRKRDWQTFVPGTPPDGTIGNVDVLDVCPVQWERPFARADLATRVIVGRDLETAQTIDDPLQMTYYGIEPFEKIDLLTESDYRISTLGNRYLRNRSPETAPRVRSVSLDARTSTGALDLMATVDVYRPSRYRCRLQYERGLVFDAEHFATGVAHEVSPSSWTLDLNLDLAEPFVADVERWDDAYWDSTLWT